MRTYSALTRDYVRAAITAPASPLADTVQFAFLNVDIFGDVQPSPADWVAGSWEPAQLPTGEWVARCLIGPGGTIPLTPGLYAVWVKVIDNPTVPVMNPSTLTIT